jgi:hypothetical protein
MSTPIRQEVSPEDPKFYAPPRWRRGEVVAPSIQPSLRSTEYPGPQAYPDWTSQHGDEVLADELGRSTYKRAVDALPKGRQLSARRGSTNMRVTALAIAAGVVLWTAVCVALALGRLDVINFEQLRNGLPLAKGAETSAVAAPHIASVALAEKSNEVTAPSTVTEVTPPPAKDVATPTLAVADAIGESNAALPLAISVSNATPGTTLTLSGLPAGTKLSSGAVAGDGQWRIVLDDQSRAANDSLRNTFVMPPSDFVGAMTITAELRSGTDQPIARAPVRLTWRPSPIDFSETVKPTPSALSVPADDNAAPKDALLAWQDEPTTNGVSSQPKVRKHISSTSKTHAARNQHAARKRQNRAPSIAQDPQATVTPWREVRSPYAYDMSADRHAGRRSSWGDDVQNIIDRSWQRCTFNCDREILR